MEKPTDWLKVLCVAAMVLGFSEACCDVFSLGSTVLTDKLAALSPASRAAAKTRAENLPVIYATTILSLVHALALLVAPALVLRDLVRFAPLLRIVLWAGCVLLPLSLLYSFVFDFEQMQTNMRSNPSLPFGDTLMWLVIVFSVGWSACKVGFFALVLRVLGRAVREKSPATPAAG